MSQKTVGVLGGGQLGRMLSQPASLLGIPLLFLDSGDKTPAKLIAPPPEGHSSHLDGPFNSRPHILELAEKSDILTIEIEHVNADVLAEVEEKGKCDVQPKPATIKLIQDKYAQKVHLEKHGIAVAPFSAVSQDASREEWEKLGKELGTPMMLKSRTMAYDGKGNSPLASVSEEDVQSSLTQLGAGTGGKQLSLYAEGWMPFVKEIAVMVVRNVEGQVVSYDAVETVHKDSILRVCIAPLRMHDWDSKKAGGKWEESVNVRAKKLAEKAVGVLDGAGVFGVEMFLMQDGSLLINEIAPRPHNSGHHTIEACHTSQFENHLRAILSLPLGSTSLRVPAAGMVNLIGSSNSMEPIDRAVRTALGVTGASVHLYGKKECRKGRKVGHITVTGENDAVVRERMRTILRSMEDIDEEWIGKTIGSSPLSSSASASPSGAKSHPQPLVGIIMGSDSDLPTLLPGARILDKFEIPYELTICSAHRTPQRMVDYARNAAGRGLKCIVAGAGGAAHLPGMVASETALPVVGVPVKGSVLDGVDSLYSIVQMPRGIPTATVGINNSTNAALLAIRIIAASDPKLLKRVEEYAESLEEEVLEKVDALEQMGWEAYASERLKK
ncbi:AIR carboxylase-domain-containing protein [Filobasidium floriforme]|uniref:AIR carboxylase-domain-containing protein n=1 Tax=Filobasidium floriforme TaxID=5210 RepID=UPI001E8DD33D|nr:AIR carboxylase-domain-containing protein [Filobasidium floriforme]KAH8080107.1 AIR carboxylase-domain-containing protein [Filobasidium floriforme]